MVRLRAYGTYTMRVADPAKFLTEIVGTDGEFTTEEIEFQIRNLIVTHFSQIIATSRHPGARHGGEHHRPRQDRARADRADGRRVRPRAARPSMIENVSLPAEVEAALDKRTATGVAGDLSRYTEFSAAEAMTTSAANPGGGGGMAAGPRHGRGHGDGRAHGAHAAPGARRPAAAGRADPAAAARAAKRWHVAVDGQGHRPLHAATSSGGMVVGRQR